MRIVAVPLTPKAFAPYGDVLTPPDDFGRAYFDEGLQTSRSTARPSLYLSRVRPVTSLPLDVSRWLVVVAPSAADGGPDAARAVAFLAGPGHGVTYHAGTWHHPLTILDRPARFAVVMWRDGTSTDEEFRTLAAPVLIDMGAPIWPPCAHTLRAPRLSRGAPRRGASTARSRRGFRTRTSSRLRGRGPSRADSGRAPR